MVVRSWLIASSCSDMASVSRRHVCIYKLLSYSQTFENKSSLPPPNPPAGLLLLVAVVVVVVVVGAALLQPPKSSSWPHPGLFAGTCELVAGAAGWLGAAEDHASLLPQASMLP